MTKGNPEGNLPRHKAMAEGQKIKTMKHGGMCKKEGGKVHKPKKKK